LLRSLFQGLVEETSLFLPMPKPGTEMPAFPSLFKAEVFRPPFVEGAGGGGLTAWYDGGGEETCADTSLEDCLAGNRGGSLGCGFAGWAVSGEGAEARLLCMGGGGRWLVCRPVLSARYGTGGPAGRCCSSISSAGWFCTARFVVASSVCDRGAPSPLVCGVISLGKAAPP
jgi:hypothetical protein